MHLEVSVGTGTGNKVQEIQNLMLIAQGQEKLVQAQGGVDGPLVTMNNVANTFRRMVQAAGFKATQQFVAGEKDLEAAAGQPRNPPPEDPLVQAERLKAEAAAQAKAAELAQRQRESEAEFQVKMRELELKDKELDIKASELAIEQARLNAERERTAVESFHREADRASSRQAADEQRMRDDMAAAEPKDDDSSDMAALADGLRAQGEGIAQGLNALAQAVLAEQEIVRGPDGRVSGARRRPPIQ